MLVDAQDLGANGCMVLAGVTLEPAEEIALHGSRPDTFPPPQTTPVDAIKMLLEDQFLEALAGSLEGLNAWDVLPEGAAAVQAAALANLQIQHAVAKAPVVMPNRPPAATLIAQAGSAAVGARYRSDMPGRYRNRPSASLYRGNLVLGQA
jgi:hypothetical protein